MRSLVASTFLTFARRKTLRIFLFVVFFLLAAVVVVSQFALTEQSKVIVDFSISAIEILGLVFVLFFGVRLLPDEQDQKTLDLLRLYARPRDVILGKYFGFVTVLCVYFVFSLFVFFAVLVFFVQDLSILGRAILALCAVFVKLLVVLVLVILFSLFLSPVFSLILGALVYLVSHMLPFLKYYYAQYDISWFVKIFVDILYWVFPHFEQLALQEHLFSPFLAHYHLGTISMIFGFHVGYIFLLLFIAIVVYSKSTRRSKS